MAEPVTEQTGLAIEAENRDRALLEERACYRADEKLAQHRLAVGTHDQQAGVQALDLFQNLVSRWVRRVHDVRRSVDLVGLQELDRPIGTVGRVAPDLVDRDDVHFRADSQPRRLKRQKRSRRLEAAVVCDHDRIALAQRVYLGTENVARARPGVFVEPGPARARPNPASRGCG
jgi:hypothetical protein